MIRPSRFGIKFAPSPKITLEYRKNDNELQYASVDLNECNWNEDDESDILNFVVEKRSEFSDPRVSHSQLKRLILKIRDEMIKSLRKPMKENNIDRKSDDDLNSTEDVSEISEIEKLEDAETKEEGEGSHSDAVGRRQRRIKSASPPSVADVLKRHREGAGTAMDGASELATPDVPPGACA